MNRTIRQFLLLAIALCSAMSLHAAVTFVAQAPARVVEGNKFNVTFVLSNAEGSGFTPPEIAGATKIFGPALSTSYSSSWVNGKSSHSSSQEYTMIYKATRTGRLAIGPASIDVNGHRMTTRPISVEVVAANHSGGGGNGYDPDPYPQHQQQQRQRQWEDPLAQSADKAVTGKDLFVRIEMSRPRVFEQQAVVCTIKLYTKYQISKFMPTLQPSFDGFLIEEVPMQPSLNNVETYNGQQYMVAVLKKCILYPQQSGKLTITSGNYDVNAVQYENFRTPFGTLSQPVEKELKVTSNSATVNILPLPEPRPASFTGAVGKFQVTTDLKPASLKTYQAATYSYNITGTGNIKYIKAPELTWPKQFDVYDPKNTVTATPGAGNVSGSVRIDYTFIPQFAGEFDLPATEFTYFDPEKEQYEHIAVPARHLVVAKGEGAPSAHYTAANIELRPDAKGDLGLSREQSFLLDKPLYYAGYAIPLAAFIALLYFYRKTLRERADVLGMRTKRASKVANKRLKNARTLATQGNRTAFYAEMLTALWGYMSDKLSIPGSELNKDNIATELEAYGVDETLRNEAIALIDQCEFAQYAPQLESDDMNHTLDTATSIIDRLEGVKRVNKTAAS